MKKVLKKRRSRIKNVFKWSEIKNTILGTLIVLILSPLSIVLGYKLNEHLSRPILSIENVSHEEIYTLNNLAVVENYFSKSANYKEYKIKNYLTQPIDLGNIIQYKDGLSCIELEKHIKKQISEYQDYLNKKYEETKIKIKQLDKATASELLILSISNFDDFNETNNTNYNKKQLQNKFTNILNQITQEKQYVFKLGSTVRKSLESILFNISILNKGSTDGLIRYEGYIIIKGKELIIAKSNPPQIKDLYAVPVYDVNPKYETNNSNAVGRIEKNTMTEFWFILKDTIKSASDLNLCIRESYEVVLEDQDHKKIRKIVTNKKP